MSTHRVVTDVWCFDKWSGDLMSVEKCFYSILYRSYAFIKEVKWYAYWYVLEIGFWVIIAEILIEMRCAIKDLDTPSGGGILYTLLTHGLNRNIF